MHFCSDCIGSLRKVSLEPFLNKKGQSPYQLICENGFFETKFQWKYKYDRVENYSEVCVRELYYFMFRLKRLKGVLAGVQCKRF